ncbi:MAG: hypothetical protein PHY30_03535 [Candidatus Pacebacteria bacterium]|nr:hypothetical protein [Candidatus Paceibacterota bacterium]
MDLRKKHPIFRYKSFDYNFKNGNLNISFDFKIEPDIKFKPSLKIKNIPQKDFDKDILENLIFNLGMIELVSYYKATCSPKIIVECGNLSAKQKAFWKKVYLKGLGEFFFINKIDFTKKDFIKIECESKKEFKKKKVKAEDKVLLPIGGGKDSIVSLNLLKNENLCLFGLNPTKEIKRTTLKKEHIYVERRIDKKLLELNNQGYLNGHTPFSTYLAFLTFLTAYLINTKYIALSNERSSNEETTTYLGRKINHQWSKSLEAENYFRDYAREFLIDGIEYFSFLRPLYEIQIAKIFCQFKDYYKIFLSCNEANKTYSGTKKKTEKWCGNCSKCLFVFAILYPFIDEKDLFEIFNKNLFEDKKLRDEMLKLIGKVKIKSFECIGTREESLIAFYLSHKKAEDKKYYLLNCLNFGSLDKKANKILNSFDEKNNLPKKFKNILEHAIRES